MEVINDQAGVIVQDDRFDATTSVTVCPLTTNPVDAPLIRIPVEPTASTGIEQPSLIMIDKITTMPRANVLDHVVRRTYGPICASNGRPSEGTGYSRRLPA